MQYAFVLPMQTLLILQDENGCGVSEVIDGKLTVDLSSNAVNNCRDQVKVLEVESNQDTCYSKPLPDNPLATTLLSLLPKVLLNQEYQI